MAILQNYLQEERQINGLSYLLKVFYVNNPDELGNLDYWHGKIDELYQIYNWKKFYNKVNFEIWNTKHPDLCQYLLDYDLNPKNGLQGAAGISIKDFVAISVDPTSDLMNSEKYKNGVLSHEFGHTVSWQWGMMNVKMNWIQTQVCNTFKNLVNIKYATVTQGISDDFEKWAEVWKSFFGTYQAQEFSKGDALFSQKTQPDLWTIVRLGECLCDTLGDDHITDLKINTQFDSQGNLFGYITYLHHHWTLWWDNPVWEAIDTYFNLYKDNGRGGWTYVGFLNK